MAYTTSNNECLVQDEGTVGSEIGFLDIANGMASLIGKDGINPPFYKADDFSNTFILNHNKLRLYNCVFKDRKKAIEMTTAYGVNNDIGFHIADTEFTDGEVIDLNKKRAKNGCVYILNSDGGGAYKHMVHIAGDKQVSFYGSTFKSYSNTTKFVTTSSIDPRVYSCTFDGVGINQSQGVDVEAPTISNVTEASYSNYGTGYNNAKYINCKYPIYDPKVETNETNTSFINCTYTARSLRTENTDSVITDGTWVDTAFNIEQTSSTVSDLIRKFTLTVNSDTVDCNYIYKTTEDGFDIMQTGQSLTIGTKEFDRIIAGESSITEKTNHEVRCGKPGYIRIDRILSPKQTSISSLGESVETVKNVGTLFNLTVDDKVNIAGYSHSGVTIDHTNTKIIITEDTTAQQLYDTMNTDSNSIGGIKYGIHYEMVGTNKIKTSYDIDIDNSTFTGDFELTATITKLNGGSVNGSYTDSTQDSFLKDKSSYSFEAYKSVSDRDSSTNVLYTGTQYAFKYDTLSPLLTNDTIYLRIDINDVEIQYKQVIVKGNNTIDTGTAGAIVALGSKIDNVDTKLTDEIINKKVEYKADISTLATKANIDALNDFNPSTDVVARVTLVDTTTANTDMRGTDSAITSLDGIATTTNINALNNITASDVWNVSSRTITNTEFGLSTDTINAVATEVEKHLIDEADGQTIINAIVSAIGNTNIDEATLVASIRTDLERSNGKLDLAMKSSEYTAPDNTQFTPTDRNALNALSNYDDTSLSNNIDAIKAKTDTLVNADISTIAKTTELVTINNNVKKASLSIPANENI